MKKKKKKRRRRVMLKMDEDKYVIFHQLTSSPIISLVFS